MGILNRNGPNPLYTETKAIMAREDVHQAIRTAGFMPVDSSPTAMTEQIKREVGPRPGAGLFHLPPIRASVPARSRAILSR